MKKVLITLYILGSILIVRGQLSYFGKKNYINYGFNSSVLLDNYNYKGNYKDLGLNTGHEFSLHRINSKRSEIFTFYEYSRTGFLSSAGTFPSLNSTATVSRSYTFGLTNNKLGVGFRFYLKKILGKNFFLSAPYGRFIDLKPFFLISNIRYRQFKDQKYQILNRISTPGFSLSIGRQTVFFETIPFFFGVQSSFIFSFINAYGDTESVLYGGTPDPIKRIKANSIVKSYNKSILEFKIGIGKGLF